MDTSDSTIRFESDGICEYCKNFEGSILPNWRKGEGGDGHLMAIADEIRKHGAGKEFDCIMGISGGLDSCYATYVCVKQMRLRPLLFHVDAGWNTDQAVGNIERIVDGLRLNLYTEVVNWEEVKDLQRAFLRSQIPHQDLVQDTAFFSTLYKFTKAQRIRYVITGGNFSTECVREPEEWGATFGVDKTLLLDIHSRFGTIPLKSFPITSVFASKIYYKYFLGQRVIKPLDLIRYKKKEAEDTLHKLFGWRSFRHKHHESRFTRFLEDYWLPRKFGIDRRRAHFSSLILTDQMSREEALERVSRPECDEEFLEQEFDYVATKLDLTTHELREIFCGSNKTCADYRSERKWVTFAYHIMRLLGLEKRLFK